jgi:hypothetical protein
VRCRTKPTARRRPRVTGPDCRGKEFARRNGITKSACRATWAGRGEGRAAGIAYCWQRRTRATILPWPISAVATRRPRLVLAALVSECLVAFICHLGAKECVCVSSRCFGGFRSVERCELMGPSGEQWVNADAGPVIRPYALVGGRTQPSGRSFDLIAMAQARRGIDPDPASLEPEHLVVLRMCRLPVSVADLSAELSLPVGVVRVILADLREMGFIDIRNPVPPAQFPVGKALKRVAEVLRQL